MPKSPLRKTEIFATNFKQRLSGVSSTIIQLVPLQKSLGAKIAAIGFGLPKNLPHVSIIQLIGLWHKPENRPFYIWHARRHIEMIIGIILRDILRTPIKLIFTSATQRDRKAFTHWLIHKMDRVIAVNEKVASKLNRESRIIYHGIDTERFLPRNLSTSQKILQNMTKYKLGCFGRIRFSKGTDILIDSLIELLPNYPDWTAIIAGRIKVEHINFASKLKQKIKAANLENRIIFLGEVPNNGGGQHDISLLYNELDLYATPSRDEGFGLTALEAMSSGVATIASDAGAYPEIIPPDCGIVISDINATSMSKALRIFFEEPDLTIKMGKRAAAFVRENFALKNEATAINQLYEELFSSAPKIWRK
ncbi:MAG: glycosyltransferase family 4 protein [Alphaproteobacteria bacterium]|nr:glycosyltransferase family 4 protein [Alphaproteobacteria bacterium]